MKEKKVSYAIKKKLGGIKTRIKSFQLTSDFIIRMRWVLFVVAFLLLYLAFDVGDDWFVREFANYDWARSIGF